MVAALFNGNAALSNRDGPRHCGFLTIWGLGCIQMHAIARPDARGQSNRGPRGQSNRGPWRDHVTVTSVQLAHTCMSQFEADTRL